MRALFVSRLIKIHWQQQKPATDISGDKTGQTILS
jgi:hypothetical protein